MHPFLFSQTVLAIHHSTKFVYTVFPLVFSSVKALRAIHLASRVSFCAVVVCKWSRCRLNGMCNSVVNHYKTVISSFIAIVFLNESCTIRSGFFLFLTTLVSMVLNKVYFHYTVFEVLLINRSVFAEN